MQISFLMCNQIMIIDLSKSMVFFEILNWIQAFTHKVLEKEI